MAVTYRFAYMADRSDGERVVVQASAAVYETLEEALLQAGTDFHVGGNPDPVDVIDGAHHGYDEPACDVDAVVLAGKAVIRKAATVVRRRWVVHPDDVVDASIAGDSGPRRGRRAVTDSGEAEDVVAETLRELRELPL